MDYSKITMKIIDRLNDKCNDTCVIVAKNHEVTPYEVNGRKRYVVDQVQKPSNWDNVVYTVNKKYKCKNKWDKVYNATELYIGNLGPVDELPKLESAINNLTY